MAITVILWVSALASAFMDNIPFTAAMVPVRKNGLRIVTRGFVRRMHEQDKGVFVWTVNRPDEMRRLLDIGVDGIISDYPAVLRRVVEERLAAGQE